MKQFSVILTHYNKDQALLRCITSFDPIIHLIGEFLVVDDASTSPEWQNIKQELKLNPKVKLIENQDNKGPAIRINQGFTHANYDLLFFIDSDDIINPQAVELMYYIMTENYQSTPKPLLKEFINKYNIQQPIELIYGKAINVEKFIEHPIQLQHLEYSNTPLSTFLDDPHIHLASACTKELAQKSGGCNPKLFIQDESLALNLHFYANQSLFLNYPSGLRFHGDTPQLSIHKTQQHYDTFFTYLYFLEQHHHQLSAYQYNKILQKLIGQYYKHCKAHKKVTLAILLSYLGSKLNSKLVWKLYKKTIVSTMTQLKSQVRVV